AAIVLDPEQPGPGIVTERDLLDSIGAGQSPDTERVADHLSSNLTFAEPSWSLERAAEAMVRGGFRHAPSPPRHARATSSARRTSGWTRGGLPRARCPGSDPRRSNRAGRAPSRSPARAARGRARSP